jgi:hypothetical protein
MLIDAPSFVIQRRIPHPLGAVHRALADRQALGPSELLTLDADGFLHIGEPFRPTAPLGARQPAPTWRAPAYLLTQRCRVVASVELEVSMWSHGTTELQLRPVARHPERWTSRRMRRYFALAHLGADAMARRLAPRARPMIGTRALEAATTTRIATRNVTADRVGTRR